MDITVTFWAWVKKIDLFNVKCAFSTAGADIIDLNFPELTNVRNFRVCDISNNDGQDREICVKFQATLPDQNDFEEVKRGFDKCGADVVSEEFPELWDIGYFTVEKEKL